MKLLPFDLQKAQAGHPWGTRDGRKGKKIFDTEREGDGVHNSYYRLFAVLEDDDDFLYDINGRYEDCESQRDLFLYEEERVGWVVIYREKSSSYGFSTLRCIKEGDKNDYEKISKDNGTYIDTVEVRY